jgi:hypothetical protein
MCIAYELCATPEKIIREEEKKWKKYAEQMKNDAEENGLGVNPPKPPKLFKLVYIRVY